MTLKDKLLGRRSLKELKWWDILILTIIMFSQAIYISQTAFSKLSNPALVESLEFSTADNLGGLVLQGSLLLIALLYLRFRNFDFSQWKFKINLKTTFQAIGLFVLLALMVDLYFIGVGTFLPSLLDSGAGAESAEGLRIIEQLRWSSIIYAMLNGFYEEIFFIGMCLFVAPKNVRWVFLLSLLVRFSFHTYQGIVPAIGISLIGIVYYFVFEKTNRENLYPIVLSHAIADVFGLGILSYFIG